MAMEINEIGRLLCTGPLRPMDREESQAFIMAMTLQGRHKDKEQFFAKSGIVDATSYKMLGKYLTLLDGVTVDPLAQFVLSSLMSRPFECNLFAAACSYHASKHNLTHIGIDDIALMFPLGYPTYEAKLELWQRVCASLDADKVEHIVSKPSEATGLGEVRLLDGEGEGDVD